MAAVSSTLRVRARVEQHVGVLVEQVGPRRGDVPGQRVDVPGGDVIVAQRLGEPFVALDQPGRPHDPSRIGLGQRRLRTQPGLPASTHHQPPTPGCDPNLRSRRARPPGFAPADSISASKHAERSAADQPERSTSNQPATVSRTASISATTIRRCHTRILRRGCDSEPAARLPSGSTSSLPVPSRDLCPIRETELGEYVLHVVLRRAFGQVQRRSDLLVRVPFRNEGRDLDLTGRERSRVGGR